MHRIKIDVELGAAKFQVDDQGKGVDVVFDYPEIGEALHHDPAPIFSSNCHLEMLLRYRAAFNAARTVKI